MKNKTWLIGLSILAFGVCAALAVIVGWLTLYFQNSPPDITATNGYFVRGDAVYFHPGFPTKAFKMNDADARTFKILDVHYGMDQTHVYLDGLVIPSADPASFQTIAGNYSKDARHVYLNKLAFSNDPDHFKIVEGHISTDSQHIYWDGKIASDDPSHLAFVPTSIFEYFTDSSSVYVLGKLIQGADPETFVVIADYYAKDKNTVYYMDQALPGVDMASFEMIWPPYARDSQSVYWMAQKMDGADPKTFRVVDGLHCAIDSKHAYFENAPIPNVDPATFPANANSAYCTATKIKFYQ